MKDSPVNLGVYLEPQYLEAILLKAAKDLGYRVSVRHDKKVRFDLNPDNPVKESLESNYTRISLWRGFIPKMSVEFAYLDSANSFCVYYGWWPYGFASEKEVKRYVDSISRNLSIEDNVSS